MRYDAVRQYCCNSGSVLCVILYRDGLREPHGGFDLSQLESTICARSPSGAVQQNLCNVVISLREIGFVHASRRPPSRQADRSLPASTGSGSIVARAGRPWRTGEAGSERTDLVSRSETTTKRLPGNLFSLVIVFNLPAGGGVSYRCAGNLPLSGHFQAAFTGLTLRGSRS
jgi:hypothetical protein